MDSRNRVLWVAGVIVAAWSGAAMAGGGYSLDCGSVAAEGKVCKLVCETNKLTAICYACECETICIPGPSRRGCKHCMKCGGEPLGGECDECGCRSHTPECEFCWRDWFACGCARPRTVTVLTKHEAEKEIGWYHWEVVDAACGQCEAGAAPPNRARCVYKAAPEGAAVGDIFSVSDEELPELMAMVNPNASPEAKGDAAPSASLGESLAELLGRLLRR